MKCTQIYTNINIPQNITETASNCAITAEYYIYNIYIYIYIIYIFIHIHNILWFAII